jgi:hypothetical protein
MIRLPSLVTRKHVCNETTFQQIATLKGDWASHVGLLDQRRWVTDCQDSVFLGVSGFCVRADIQFEPGVFDVSHGQADFIFSLCLLTDDNAWAARLQMEFRISAMATPTDLNAMHVDFDLNTTGIAEHGLYITAEYSTTSQTAWSAAQDVLMTWVPPALRFKISCNATHKTSLTMWLRGDYALVCCVVVIDLSI